jgi:GT2 family glycosyltransferase
MEPQPSAPPVVAVVVANEPGDWFEEALVALGNQDYPNQSVLVMDAGGDADSARRVASILPDAYLRRVPTRPGFAAAANDVLQTVQGASFLVFCHDDVAMEPDAIRLMVEEALRSNAGIVAPKVVEWDHPDRLLEVGLVVDKTGACASVVDRGELDQEQHDAVKDVFAVSSTCLLVRSDLFNELGGFDPEMGDHGADVDLCWRAQVAGARVLVAPQARVRHHNGSDRHPEESLDKDGVQSRHHLRTMFKSYSLLTLLRVVPQAMVVTLVEAVVALFARRWGEARQLGSAWIWNISHLNRLRPLRRAVHRTRAVPDSEVRRLQVRGSVRLTNYLQRRLHAEERAHALVEAGHDLVEAVWQGPARAAAALLALLAVALLIGSREILTGRLPAVGQLAPLPRASTLLTHFVDGWRTTGLGSESSAPPMLGILGVLGTLLLGGVGLLQKLLVLGAWPIAAVGAWRFGRHLGSPLGRLVGVIAYVAVALPYNALARGQWGGLVAYAAAPWLLAPLLRLTGLPPFRPESAGPGDDGPAWRQILLLGVGLAVVAAFVPSIALALVVAAGGLLLGSVVAGQPTAASTALLGALGALGVAVVLLVPWSVELLLPGGWSTVTGVARLPDVQPGLGELLRFQVGPMGAPPLGWALLVVAAVPLVLGREWRFTWAIRLWMMALTCVIVAWAGGQGWIPLQFQSPDVLLAFAAAAFAGAAALGAVAFETDLRGQRFGWRQGLSVAAGATIAAITLPVLGGATDGKWNMPSTDLARSVAWMEPGSDVGAFRVLWLGDPEVLPLDSWRFQEGVGFATSRNGAPDAADLLPGRPSAATTSIAEVLRVAQNGGTARLGRLLAPMAVRYIVVPTKLAPDDSAAVGSASTGSGPDGSGPTSSGPPIAGIPPGLTRALGSQLDLRLLPADASLAVYENTAWGPGRSLLPEAVTAAPGGIPAELGGGADLAGSPAVVASGGPVRFTGQVPAAGTVLLAEGPSSHWSLEVGGRGAERTTAFGVANAFDVERAGPGRMRFRTPILRYGLVLLPLLLWAGLVRFLVVTRPRRRRGTASDQ